MLKKLISILSDMEDVVDGALDSICDVTFDENDTKISFSYVIMSDYAFYAVGVVQIDVCVKTELFEFSIISKLNPDCCKEDVQYFSDTVEKFKSELIEKFKLSKFSNYIEVRY